MEILYDPATSLKPKRVRRRKPDHEPVWLVAAASVTHEHNYLPQLFVADDAYLKEVLDILGSRFRNDGKCAEAASVLYPNTRTYNGKLILYKAYVTLRLEFYKDCPLVKLGLLASTLLLRSLLEQCASEPKHQTPDPALYNLGFAQKVGTTRAAMLFTGMANYAQEQRYLNGATKHNPADFVLYAMNTLKHGIVGSSPFPVDQAKAMYSHRNTIKKLDNAWGELYKVGLVLNKDHPLSDALTVISRITTKNAPGTDLVSALKDTEYWGR